jgi:hypothetical protein
MKYTDLMGEYVHPKSCVYDILPSIKHSRSTKHTPITILTLLPLVEHMHKFR